jgi:hypothetical protein
MTAEQFARICAEAGARLRDDPQFAAYLDARAAAQRRILGLPPKETKS